MTSTLRTAIVAAFTGLLAATCFAQTSDTAQASQPQPPAPAAEVIGVDTLKAASPPNVVVLQPKVVRYNYNAIPKDPLASALFSATIPGTGQLYNREFGRGFATAAVFYGSVLVAQYYAKKWTAMNTDTFFVAETDEDGSPTGQVHRATALKPDAQLVGLKPGEKVLVVGACITAVASYVFGIVDAARGAKRFNEKILLSRLAPDGVDVAFSPASSAMRVQARYSF
jgi:hypothetical protein